MYLHPITQLAYGRAAPGSTMLLVDTGSLLPRYWEKFGRYISALERRLPIAQRPVLYSASLPERAIVTIPTPSSTATPPRSCRGVGHVENNSSDQPIVATGLRVSTIESRLTERRRRRT